MVVAAKKIYGEPTFRHEGGASTMRNGTDHYIAISCDDELYGKVLAIDSGVYPEDFPAGEVRTMANVAILADSFNQFMQAIYYEAFSLPR